MRATLSAFGAAVFARLTADADYTARVTGGTHEDPPRGSRVRSPYVVLGEETALEDSPMQTVGHDVTLTVDVWSQARSKAETEAIIGALRRALHRQRLDVDGHRVIAGSLHVEFATVFRDADDRQPDQSWYHGVVRLRAHLEELAAA